MWMLGIPKARAQWAVGLSGGLNNNTPSVTKGITQDAAYESRLGYNVGVMGRYQFCDWLAVRADLRVSSRNYHMQRNLSQMKDVYTDHRDTYLHLPVMGDFSFGGQKLRGHLYLGGYIGDWLDAHRKGNAVRELFIEDEYLYTAHFDEKMEFDSRRDRRFNAGLLGGLGLTYEVATHWELMLESFYMYDLTSSNKTYTISNPRYNTTINFNLGVAYKF